MKASVATEGRFISPRGVRLAALKVPKRLAVKVRINERISKRWWKSLLLPFQKFAYSQCRRFHTASATKLKIKSKQILDCLKELRFKTKCGVEFLILFISARYAYNAPVSSRHPRPRRAGYCTSLTQHGLAFSQPSEGFIRYKQRGIRKVFTISMVRIFLITNSR